MKYNNHLNCLYNYYNYLINMYKPQYYSALWHCPPKFMIKGRRVLVLIRSMCLYLIAYLFYLCFIVYYNLLKNGSCTLPRCIFIVHFVAAGSIVNGTYVGADNLRCKHGLRNSMQLPTLHYTVYLIRFNKLILRSKIWNRSAPKRYVHNKLCTELIILKS
jgi:hypothetical protein